MKKLLLVLGLFFLATTVQAGDNWKKVGNLWYWYNDGKTQAMLVTPQAVPEQETRKAALPEHPARTLLQTGHGLVLFVLQR